jgi:hypothetical protein
VTALATMLLSCIVALGAAPPLAVTRMTPPDAHAVIQVRGGLAGRSAGMRTLAAGLRSLVDSAGAGESWATAAKLAGTSSDALLQRCAGRDASLVVRSGREDGGWVLALEMDGRDACDLLKSVGGRMGGGARFEVPQLGLAGCVCGPWLLVTDHAESPLMRDMVRLAETPDQPSFARSLPQGWDAEANAAVTVALRHDRLAKGVSVWSLRDQGATVQVQLLAQLEDRPLGAIAAGVEPLLDPEALPADTIACWMQSMPSRVVPAGWCTDASCKDLLQAVERASGARMAIFIGPRRDGEGPFAAAVAIELADASSGTRVHDAMLDHAAAALARLDGRPRPAMIDRSRLPIEAVRHCSEDGMAESTFGSLECLGTSELHARTVPTRRGGWRVYGSDVPWLDQVVGAIEDQPDAGPQISEARWTRVGCADGGALAAGLDRWAADRSRHGGCAKPMEVLAAVVRNAGRVSWRIREPSPGMYQAEMELVPVDASAFDGPAIAGAPAKP